MAADGKTLVLGVGNAIMGDEGFGVHVVRRLKEMPLPDDVLVEEGGVGGFNLLGSLDGVKRLIVIDVMAGAPEGDVSFFRPGPGFGEPGKSILSFHQVGVLELVQIWGLLGYEPDICFLVTRPVVLRWGTELSEPVKRAAERALGLLEEMFAADSENVERSCKPCM